MSERCFRIEEFGFIAGEIPHGELHFGLRDSPPTLEASMPIDVTPTGDYLSVRVYGVITAADLLNYSLTTEAFERQSGHALDRISDVTGVEKFELSHRDVFEFADRRKRQHLPGIARTAIIATEPIQIGLSRMYQTMTENPNLEIKIVNSLAQAREWLAAPASAAVN
jgi:hypothetical protein